MAKIYMVNTIGTGVEIKAAKVKGKQIDCTIHMGDDGAIRYVINGTIYTVEELRELIDDLFSFQYMAQIAEEGDADA